MSLLIEQPWHGSDPFVSLKNALDKASTIISTTQSIETVKTELQFWLELLPSSPASNVTPSLRSSYDPNSFGQLQSTFKSNDMEKQILSLLLDKVLIFWYSAFSELERKTLVHSWISSYCPAIHVLHALIDTLVNLSTTATQPKTLNRSYIDQLTIAEHAKQLCELILHFFGLKGSLQTSTGLERIITEIEQLPSASQRPHVWTQMLSLVSSLPDRVFNVLKRDTDARFRPETFFFNLSMIVKKSLEKSSVPLSFPYFAMWIGKLHSIGKVDCAINAFDPASFAVRSKQDALSVRMVLKELPSICVEPVIMAIIKLPNFATHNNVTEIMTLMFRDLMETSSTARFVLTQKLFLNNSQPWWILRPLLDFLYAMMKTSESWLQTITTWTNTAGEAKFIKTTPYVVQRRLNRSLIHILEHGYVTKHQIEHTDLIMALMAAVQNLLNQPLQKSAVLGMRLGEAFSKIIDPSNPLKFEGESNDDEDEPDKCPSILSDSSGTSSSNIDSRPNGQKSHDNASSSFASEYLNPDEDWIDFVERINSAASTQGEKRDVPFRKGKFVQLDLNDDLSDTSEVKTPLYLRDALTSLRSDEPKTLEVVMGVLTPLISSRPDDLPELAVSVCSTLLHVGNVYELEHFDEQRISCLVALVEYEPNRVIPHIVKEFYAQNYSLNDRYLMLDALTQGAQNLAQHKVDVRPEYNPVALKSLAFTKTPVKTVVLTKEKETPKLGTTIRKHVVTPTKTFQNRLSPLLTALLQILEYKQRERGLALLMSDARLLGKLLYSISVFIECSGPSTADFESLGRKVLDIAWTMRYHEDPFVVRAVLLSISAFVQNSPAWILFEALNNEMNESVAWLNENQNHSDEEVRTLSTIILIHLSRLYKDNPQYQPFNATT